MTDNPPLGLRRYGVVPPAALAGLTGLDVMQRMLAGDLPGPPIAKTIGFDLLEVDEGRAVFTCTPTLDHYNPVGSVNGGQAGILLDSCMGCAVHTRLKQGQGYTTLEYSVHLVRGMSSKTGPVRAEGQVLHFGRRAATAEGRIVDGAGTLLAHGTTTCLIFDA